MFEDYVEYEGIKKDEEEEVLNEEEFGRLYGGIHKGYGPIPGFCTMTLKDQLLYLIQIKKEKEEMLKKENIIKEEELKEIKDKNNLNNVNDNCNNVVNIK